MTPATDVEPCECGHRMEDHDLGVGTCMVCQCQDFIPAPPTAAVPLAVVPRELIERALDAARAIVALHSTHCHPSAARRLNAEQLIADLEAALATAGGREGGK